MSKWTSVNERLPEPEDWNSRMKTEEDFNVVAHELSYDCLSGEPEDYKYVTTAKYDYIQRTWTILDSDFPITTNALLKEVDINHMGYWISHWMPLPEPPKEVKDEQ